MAPHNVYPCLGQDRWLAVGVEDDRQWRALVTAMGSPSWALEERFASVDGRRGHDGAKAAAIRFRVSASAALRMSTCRPRADGCHQSVTR